MFVVVPKPTHDPSVVDRVCLVDRWVVDGVMQPHRLIELREGRLLGRLFLDFASKYRLDSVYYFVAVLLFF